MMMVRLDNYDDGIRLDIYDDGTFGHLIVLVRLRIYRFWIIMMMVRY